MVVVLIYKSHRYKSIVILQVSNSLIKIKDILKDEYLVVYYNECSVIQIFMQFFLRVFIQISENFIISV